MLACHAGGPGSIPGRCKTPLFSAKESSYFSRWYVYKLPKIDGQCMGCKWVEEGLSFAYLDVNDMHFNRSEKSLQDPKQAISQTLAQMYGNTGVKAKNAF